jgi:hypothetical protein
MDQGIMTLITVGLVLAAFVFVLWLLYTVVWRGVRRGLREFQHGRLTPVSASAAPEPAEAHHHRHVPFHLPRRVPADVVAAEVVPDYPPSEWF